MEAFQQCQKGSWFLQSNLYLTVLFDFQEFQDLWPQLDLVLDGGRIEGGPREAEVEGESRMASTVVDLSQQGKFKIIRRGR